MSEPTTKSGAIAERDWISFGSVLTLSLIWGSSFALTSIALEGFAPLAIAASRVWLATIPLVSLAMLLGHRFPRDLRVWGWAAALGVFSLALPFTLLAWGQQHVVGGVAAILIAAGPLFVVALSRIFLGETVAARKWLGFAIGFGGIVWLVGPDAAIGLSNSSVAGQLACLGASLSYATSAILIRRMPAASPVLITAMAALSGSVLMVPFGIPALPDAPPDMRVIAAITALGLVQTGVAQILRFYTVRRAGPVYVSAVGYLIPIWAGFLGFAFLGETLGFQALTAYAIILSGLFLSRGSAPSSPSRFPPPPPRQRHAEDRGPRPRP